MVCKTLVIEHQLSSVFLIVVSFWLAVKYSLLKLELYNSDYSLNYKLQSFGYV